MTNRGVALLAFKLCGLWLIANAAISVASIPYYWEPQFEGVRTMTVLSTLLPAVVAVGIGVPVWFSAERFADRIFPPGSQEGPPTDRLRGEPLFALALSILGVFFVADSVPGIVNAIALFSDSRLAGASVFGPDADQQRLIWSSAAKANSMAAIARFMIGVALVAGPAKLAAVAARVRKELAGTLEDDGNAEKQA